MNKAPVSDGREKRLKGSFRFFASVLFFLFPLNVSADFIPGTTMPIDSLTKGLAWEFIVEKTDFKSPDASASPVLKTIGVFEAKFLYRKMRPGNNISVSV